MSTKINAAVDGLGNLTRFRLTGGERHDITQAEALIEGMQHVETVVADRAFDADSLLERIKSMKAQPISRQGRTERKLDSMTNMFIKVVISSKDSLLGSNSSAASPLAMMKLAVRFEAFVSIAAAFIWFA